MRWFILFALLAAGTFGALAPPSREGPGGGPKPADGSCIDPIGNPIRCM